MVVLKGEINIIARKKNNINTVTVFYSITQILQFDHLTGASR